MRRNPLQFRLVRRLGFAYVRGYWKCLTQKVNSNVSLQERQLRVSLAQIPSDRFLFGEYFGGNRRKRRFMYFDSSHALGHGPRSDFKSLQQVESNSNFNPQRDVWGAMMETRQFNEADSEEPMDTSSSGILSVAEAHHANDIPASFDHDRAL